MLNFARFRFFFVFVVSFTLCGNGNANNVWAPTSDELTRLRTAQDSLWRIFSADGQTVRPGQSTPELASFIVNDLAISAQPTRISAAIRALVDQQDKNPNSSTFGHVYWKTYQPPVTDTNGIIFVTNSLSVAYLLYADRMSATDRDLLSQFLNNARTAVDRLIVNVDYTNIYVMQSWSKLFLAQIANDTNANNLALAQLQNWISRVQSVGIHEYSTSYLAFDLGGLSKIINLSSNSAAVNLAKTGLDLVWTHIAYHWFSPGERICGPQSRNYDRLFGRGEINDVLTRAGWSSSGNLELGPEAANSFVAPPATLRPNSTVARMVVERFGSPENERFTTYFEPGFNGQSICIGSAETEYFVNFRREANSDSVAIHLGAGRDIPTITTFMDGRGDYYGLNKFVATPGAHNISTHLQTFVSSVQNGPELLYISSAKYSSSTYPSLATTVTLPADAEYWLNGQPFPFMRAFSKWSTTPTPDGVNTVFNVITAPDGENEVIFQDKSTTLPLNLTRQLVAQAGDQFFVRVRLSGGPVYLSVLFFNKFNQQIGSSKISKLTPPATRFDTFNIAATTPADTAKVIVSLRSSIAETADVRIRDLNVKRRIPDVSDPRTVAKFDFVPFTANDIALPIGSTIVIRRFSTAAAIRLLGAWDINGAPVQFRLINDGLQFGAIRLTAMHSLVNTQKRGTSAFWMTAKAGLSDAGFQSFLNNTSNVKSTVSFSNSIVDVKSVSSTRTLQLRSNVDTETNISRVGAPVIDKTKVRNVFVFQ